MSSLSDNEEFKGEVGGTLGINASQNFRSAASMQEDSESRGEAAMSEKKKFKERPQGSPRKIEMVRKSQQEMKQHQRPNGPHSENQGNFGGSAAGRAVPEEQKVMSPGSGSESGRQYACRDNKISSNDCVSAGSGESGKNRPRRRSSLKKVLNNDHNVAIVMGIEENKDGTAMAGFPLGEDLRTEGPLDAAVSFRQV